MMHIVPKWRITVMFQGPRQDVTVWMHDDHVENVLRQVAGMRFCDDPLVNPIGIDVRKVDEP